MLVSAVFASLILMSTATMMSDIRKSSFEPMTNAYDIDNIRQMGEDLDLAKKSNRREFSKAVEYIPGYSTELKYWKSRRCFNITLSNTLSRMNLKCVGNGSVFNDGFEDGEYRNPAWIKTTSYGNVSVIDQYSPGLGNKALELTEYSSDSDSSFKMVFQNPKGVWNERWTASGLFYLDEYNSSDTQRQYILMNYAESESDYLRAAVGFSDSSGNQVDFRILNEGLISSTSYGTSVNWQEDTWYRWQISHTGSGNYEGRIWREGQDKPASPSTEASGAVPSGTGKAGIQLDGSQGDNFYVAHDFFKVQKK